MPPFSPGSRVVVLGAGATRAAEFSGDFEPACRPPLNADFFTQLQRIRGPKYESLVRDVIADVVALFGSNFSLTLEDYFTQLEFLADALKRAPSVGGISVRDLRKRRDRLMHAVSAVLEVSTDAAIRGSSGCSLHRQLVEVLKPKDTLISFNYDCVLDHALRQHGDGKWSARYGYTLPRPGRIEGVSAWDPVPPAAPAPSSAQTVYLLKLHGSLNWQLPPPDGPEVATQDRHQKPIKLKQRLHRQRGVPQFTVIPPVWNKAVGDDPIFDTLWRNAERAIRTADRIALAGFSFAPTDLPVESLFRVALAGRSTKLRTLVIANPSKDHRRRTRDVFAKALERGTIVRQYDRFDDFVAACPGCLS